MSDLVGGLLTVIVFGLIAAISFWRGRVDGRKRLEQTKRILEGKL